MVSKGPDQEESRPDQQIPQARFAHGAVRVPSTALDHGKVRANLFSWFALRCKIATEQKTAARCSNSYVSNLWLLALLGTASMHTAAVMDCITAAPLVMKKC